MRTTRLLRSTTNGRCPEGKVSNRDSSMMMMMPVARLFAQHDKRSSLGGNGLKPRHLDDDDDAR